MRWCRESAPPQKPRGEGGVGTPRWTGGGGSVCYWYHRRCGGRHHRAPHRSPASGACTVGDPPVPPAKRLSSAPSLHLAAPMCTATPPSLRWSAAGLTEEGVCTPPPPSSSPPSARPPMCLPVVGVPCWQIGNGAAPRRLVAPP